MVRFFASFDATFSEFPECVDIPKIVPDYCHFFHHTRYNIDWNTYHFSLTRYFPVHTESDRSCPSDPSEIALIQKTFVAYHPKKSIRMIWHFYPAGARMFRNKSRKTIVISHPTAPVPSGFEKSPGPSPRYVSSSLNYALNSLHDVKEFFNAIHGEHPNVLEIPHFVSDASAEIPSEFPSCEEQFKA